jgi:GT2 family glycosyltransferase
MAFRKSAVDAIGGFDPALDLGSVLPGGGDLDALWRVLQKGFRVVYEPQALVWHEHRRELHAVEEQLVGHQLALITFLTKAQKRSAGAQRFAVLAFLLWRLVKPGIRLVRRLAGRDPLPHRLLLRMWGGCIRGLFAYPRMLRIAAARQVPVRHPKELRARVSSALLR